MKIITWNCRQGGYRSKNKESIVLKLKPDIAVIPECENIGEQDSKNLWIGDNQKKGIGIFSYSNFKLKIHPQYNEDFKYIVPIEVTGPTNFILIAIWSRPDDLGSGEINYIKTDLAALDFYKSLFKKNTIIIGDLNWNKIWDSKNQKIFTETVDFLKGKGIESAYHKYFKEDFGEEQIKTLYHNNGNPYHIDYCFTSKSLKVLKVEIGKHIDWKKYSDHVPVIVNLDERKY